MDQKPHLVQEFVIASPWDIPFGLIESMGIQGIALDNDLMMSLQGCLPSQELATQIIRETDSRGLKRIIATNSSHDKAALCTRMLCGVVQPGKFWIPRKPMVSYYAKVSRQLGLESHRVVLIDDKLDNCLGAIRAGMWAIRVTPLGLDTLIFDRLVGRQANDERRLAKMNVQRL